MQFYNALLASCAAMRSGSPQSFCIFLPHQTGSRQEHPRDEENLDVVEDSGGGGGGMRHITQAVVFYFCRTNIGGRGVRAQPNFFERFVKAGKFESGSIARWPKQSWAFFFSSDRETPSNELDTATLRR